MQPAYYRKKAQLKPYNQNQTHRVMKKPILMAIVLIVSTALLKAEKDPIRYGKLSKEELSLKSYEKDTAANAIVLCDYGKSDFIYSDNTGLQYKYTRNIRIKILKKEGYEWAKFEIPVYKKLDNISRIKGTTYNVKNGKTIKEKLNNQDIYNEDYSKNWELIKFEMPSVKEGSIIDIEYSILSESYHIRKWYFQKEIPVLHSEYRVTIPEYFHYKQLEKGYLSIGNRSQNSRTVTITGTDKQRTSDGRSTKTEFQAYSFNYIATDYTYISEDVPAFYTEDYITSKENYLSSIEFELGSVKWPNKPVKNYTNTWEAINKQLLFDSDFGARTKGAGFLKDELSVIETLNASPEAKLEATYNLVRNHMNWNKGYSIYSFEQNKAWREGNGSVGDINLTLIAALNRIGLDANPVLLSTRSNGFIHPAQIIIDQFNYVIAAVNLDGNTILLDATEKYTPAGVLPERCLNGQGRQIDDHGGKWVDLKPAISNKKMYQAQIAIEPDLSIKGRMVEKYEDYGALDKRNTLAYYSSEEDYLNEYQKNFDKFTLELDSISGKKELKQPVTLYYSFETEPYLEQAGNLLMINPLLLGKKTSNPFKLQERNYPVDYTYPYSTSFMAIITVPEGYEVESVPQSKRLLLPDQSGAFIYSVQQSGNIITLISKFDIQKITFLPDSYLHLKEFYNQVIDSQSKQIILKKI